LAIPYVNIHTISIDDYFPVIIISVQAGIRTIFADQLSIIPHFPYIFRNLATIHMLIIIGSGRPALSWGIIVLYNSTFGQIKVIPNFLISKFIDRKSVV